MELSKLASKQKRLKFWQEFVENEVKDKDLKVTIKDSLKDYRNLLLSTWESQDITEETIDKIESLERELEKLNEEARMTNTISE